MRHLIAEGRQLLEADEYDYQEPGVLYHGTTKAFTKFELKHAGRRDSGNLGRGIYLSTSPSMARGYAEENTGKFGGTPIVLRVKANMKKTADFPSVQKELKKLGIKFPIDKHDTESAEKVRQWMLDHGYDSAKLGKEIVVYLPERLRIERVANVPSSQERRQIIFTHLKKTGKKHRLMTHG